MKSLFFKQAERFLREQKNYKRWLAVFLCLAVAVTMGTVAALRYRGIAVTADNEEVHVHTDECYEEKEQLICGMEESEGTFQDGHVHDESCYAESEGESWLSCDREEHAHDDGCYETISVSETEVRTETDEDGNETTVEETSWHEETVLSCDREEHVHDDGCYSASDGETILICGMEESEGILEDGHVHDESCYEAEKVLICELETEKDVKDVVDDEKAEEEFQDGSLSVRGSGYEITVSYSEEARVPENAELEVREIEEGSDAYNECYGQMLSVLPKGQDDEEQKVTFARFFDITILADGEKVEPAAAVTVQINYDDAVMDDGKQNGFAVHFPEGGGTEILDVEIKEGKEFGFNQNSFSITGTVATESGTEEEDVQGGKLVAAGDGYTVTLSYDKEAKVPAGAALTVEEIVKGLSDYYEYLECCEEAIRKENKESEEQETVFAKFFRISIENENGEKIGTNNVAADIQVVYMQPLSAENDGVAATVLDSGNGFEVSGEIAGVSEEEEITVFTASSALSEDGLNLGTVMMENVFYVSSGMMRSAQRSAALGRHDDVSGYLKRPDEGANGWQIVENGYGGNDAGQKEGDKNVRVQKNVIPTDTENEFQVYLSIDVKTSIQEQIDYSAFGALTHTANVENGVVTNASQVVGVAIGSQGDKNATVTLRDPNGNIIFQDKNVGWGKTIDPNGGNANSVTLVYQVGDLYYQVGNVALVNGQKYDDFQLSQEAYDAIRIQQRETSVLENVVDQMGEYITCEEIIGGDYTEAIMNDDGKSITWVPLINPDCAASTPETEDGKTTYWLLNAAQLVYKVKLHVEAEGFQSCAATMDNKQNSPQCDVNASATLTYDGGAVNFPVPAIRGLLYDIALKKADADNQDVVLSGAEFTLQDAEGNPVYGSYGTLLTAVSDENGIARFEDLPYGTYQLTETQAPEGYKAVGNEGKRIGSVTVCYTTDADSLQQDSAPKQANMIYKNSDTEAEITVTNEKIPAIQVVKAWDDNENKNGLRPDSISFTVEYQESESSVWLPVTDADGKQAKYSLSDDGSWETVIEEIPEATAYRITEDLSAESAYQLKPLEDRTNENGDAVLSAGTGEWIWNGKTKAIDAYTITNELKKQHITLVKIEEGSDPKKVLEGAEFKLYIRPKPADGDRQNGLEALLEEAGSEEWENPQISGENGIIFDGQLKYGEYWLEETKAPDGYTEKDHPYVLTINHEGVSLNYNGIDLTEDAVSKSDDGTFYTIEIPNKTSEKPVALWKKATGTGEVEEGVGIEDSKMLPGAEFDVYYTEDLVAADLTWPDGGEEEILHWKSVEGGQIVDSSSEEPIDKLKIGRYMIRETKAPAGYNLPADSIIITVTSSNITLDKGGTVIPTEEKTYKIYIDNSVGIELPKTGGTGTIMYTFGGFALMAAALMYGFSMRRKRGKGGCI